MSERARRNIVRIVIVVVVMAVLIPWKQMGQYLESINYRFDYLFSDDHGISHFDQYQDKFDALVEEIDTFVETQPDFFRDFTGECFVKLEPDQDNEFYSMKYGLEFERKEDLPYPDNMVFVAFSAEKTKMISDYSDVFPDEFYYSYIALDSQYPDYVFFCSDERSTRMLVYTRSGRPEQLIEEYSQNHDFVRVTEVAPDWYDISHY